MFFSVVIPTYNRAESLKKALEAYYKQSLEEIDYEIIVVDDGSTDDTAEVVKVFKKKHKNISYCFQENQGQGIARNKGIAKAKGKVILFGQDDIIPTHDFLYEHQKFHYMHPEENSAVLGFTAWYPHMKVNSFMEWMVNGSSVFGRFGGHQFAYEKLQGKVLADYNFFYTSNLSLKLSLLRKYPFDPQFSGYGWEDIELGYRLEQEAKMKLYYNSWAVAYHDHYMEEGSLASRMRSIGRSAWVFHRKYPELGKVPSFTKWLILRVISCWPVVWTLSVLKRFSSKKITGLYYYVLSKKYFLEGLAQGK